MLDATAIAALDVGGGHACTLEDVEPLATRLAAFYRSCVTDSAARAARG
jgi:hypothetical protein